jgi:hypothetical protein
VRERYRLSPAEIGLVRLLLDGETLRRAADQRGIPFETARTCFKRVYEKTCTPRQLERIDRLRAELREPRAPDGARRTSLRAPDTRAGAKPAAVSFAGRRRRRGRGWRFEVHRVRRRSKGPTLQAMAR